MRSLGLVTCLLLLSAVRCVSEHTVTVDGSSPLIEFQCAAAREYGWRVLSWRQHVSSSPVRHLAQIADNVTTTAHDDIRLIHMGTLMHIPVKLLRASQITCYLDEVAKTTYDVKVLVPTPYNFTASTASATALHLSWKVNISVLYDANITLMSSEVDIVDSNVVVRNQSSVTIRNLYPYTTYKASMLIKTDFGTSKTVVSNSARTLSARPIGAPRLQSVTNYTNSITVKYEPPPERLLNGELKGYIISWKRDSESSIRTASVDATVKTYNITDLQPFTWYEINVRLLNDRGDGPPARCVTRTDEGDPPAPAFWVTPKMSYSMTVNFWPPEVPNGIIRKYGIYIIRNKTHQRFEDFKSTNKWEKIVYNVTNLLPYTSYKLRMVTFNTKHHSSKPKEVTAITDISEPTAPVYFNVTCDKENSMYLTWKRPEKYYKQISALVVRYRADEEGVTRSKTAFLEDEINYKQPKPYEVIKVVKLVRDFTYHVQLSCIATSLYNNIEYQSPFSSDIVLSVNNNCSGFPLWPVSDMFLTIELKTTGFPLKQEAQSIGVAIPLGLAIAGATILLLLVVGLYTVRKRIGLPHYLFVRQDSDPVILNYVPNDNKYGADVIEDSCMPVDEFDSHVSLLSADGDCGFSDEYYDINRMCNESPEFAGFRECVHSMKPENKSKNRYINIAAFDHSRVILRQLPGVENSDYINANYVDGYHMPRAYIAAQGPLPETFDDFWRMIWDENTDVIVMITNLQERGRRKCDQYWPVSGEKSYGMLTVRLVSEKQLAHYTMRTLTIRNSKVKRRSCTERQILQFHYTDWPDHGVPTYVEPVLSFVRNSARAQSAYAGPIVVHCSAGVGRTGTYIMIDSMMRQIVEKQSLNIKGFLLHIRKQRHHLVQTEYIRMGITEMDADDLSDYINSLYSRQHFECVTDFEVRDYYFKSASNNADKNRPQSLLPVELSRVRLPAVPGEEGSDYINATYLQGYFDNEEFIVSQHPMQSTVKDFWRAVFDLNCTTIVLLSQIQQDDYLEFWSEKDKVVEYGHFSVQLVEESHQLNHVTRDFLLQSTEDDDQYTVRMVETSYWPESCSPPASAYELIQTVRSWKSFGHIIVVDQFGGTPAATFAALMTCSDSLRHDQKVDVYQTCKLYHMKRPGVFNNPDQLLFIYRALEGIVNDKNIPMNERDSGIANCVNHPEHNDNATDGSGEETSV